MNFQANAPNDYIPVSPGEQSRKFGLDSTQAHCLFRFLQLATHVSGSSRTAMRDSLLADRYGYSKTRGNGNKMEHTFTALTQTFLEI